MDDQQGHKMSRARIVFPGLPYRIAALIATTMLQQQSIDKDMVALKD
jgi:hypothetical protein